MCPVKTENLSFNASKSEADFWRELAGKMKARSRGELQKVLLAIGLEAINKRAAARLRKIRAASAGREWLIQAGSAALLGLFVLNLVAGDGNAVRRAPRACRAVARQELF